MVVIYRCVPEFSDLSDDIVKRVGEDMQVT